MRFLFLFAFFGARRFDKFISILAQRQAEFHRPTRMFFAYRFLADRTLADRFIS
jgi:hypothetical protein